MRKYPHEYKEIIQVINNTYNGITDPEAKVLAFKINLFYIFIKVALIWIVGEFGEHLEEAPFILEDFIKSLSESNENVRVKYIVISAKKNIIILIKLFIFV